MTEFGSVLMTMFGIGLLIFVHELGHFLAARWIGAHVEVFSLGFGPRLLGWRRGATDYRLSLVPLGGYVAVAGQDPSDRRHPARLNLWHKSVGQRIVFFAGGVAMNLLFALVAFPLVFRAGVEFTAPIVGGIEPGGAAWEAGLQKGDRIVAIDGKPVWSFDNHLVVEAALAGPRGATLRVRRDDREFEVRVLPQYDPQMGIYDLGIQRPVRPQHRLSVTGGGPAAAAGLADEDELLSVDGLPDGANATLLDQRMQAGAALQLRVRRDGKEIDATVTPRALPDQPPVIGVLAMPNTVRGLRPGLPLLQDLGLQHGDRILRIDGVPFTGPDLAVVRNGPPRLAMVVWRQGREVELGAAATPEARAAFPDHVHLRADLASLQLQPQPGGPAAAAGMQAGDRVIAIDGEPLDGWAALQKKVQGATAGKPLHLQVRRGTQDLEIAVAPMQKPRFDYGYASLGVFQTEVFRADGMGAALRTGVVCSVDLVKQLYVQLKRMFTGEVAAKNLSSIITISRVTYAQAQSGAARFWYFLALLSLNLAVINLLPIPVLDGGHLLFLVIERIKGSPVSGRVFAYSQILGLIFVLALVVFATYNDILRLV